MNLSSKFGEKKIFFRIFIFLKMLSNKENQAANTTSSKSTSSTCETNFEFKFSSEPTLESLGEKLLDFCKERNWQEFHSPRNLLLALVGEVGELSEIL